MREWPSGWEEAQRPNLKAHLLREHCFFLLVYWFAMSLRVGHVSSWGRSEAVFADQACCLHTNGTIIGLCIEQGRLRQE